VQPCGNFGLKEIKLCSSRNLFNPMEVARCAADFVAKEQEIYSKSLSFNYGTIILTCGKSIKLAKKWRNQQSE
jgi:hypothetical protein